MVSCTALLSDSREEADAMINRAMAFERRWMTIYYTLSDFQVP